MYKVHPICIRNLDIIRINEESIVLALDQDVIIATVAHLVLNHLHRRHQVISYAKSFNSYCNLCLQLFSLYQPLRRWSTSFDLLWISVGLLFWTIAMSKKPLVSRRRQHRHNMLLPWRWVLKLGRRYKDRNYP